MPRVGKKHFSYSKKVELLLKGMPKKQVKKLVIKENTPNPVAKSLRSSHLKTQIIPSKKIYNRKKINKTAD